MWQKKTSLGVGEEAFYLLIILKLFVYFRFTFFFICSSLFTMFESTKFNLFICIFIHLYFYFCTMFLFSFRCCSLHCLYDFFSLFFFFWSCFLLKRSFIIVTTRRSRDHLPVWPSTCELVQNVHADQPTSALLCTLTAFLFVQRSIWSVCTVSQRDQLWLAIYYENRPPPTTTTKTRGHEGSSDTKLCWNASAPSEQSRWHPGMEIFWIWAIFFVHEFFSQAVDQKLRHASDKKQGRGGGVLLLLLLLLLYFLLWLFTIIIIIKVPSVSSQRQQTSEIPSARQ